MRTTTLTITFSAEKLDVLVFHMEKKKVNLQEELNDTMQKLYEKYVPQTTREYVDDKVTREDEPAKRPKRPVRSGRVEEDNEAKETAELL
mgnify:CR=1 FL=1